MTTKKNTTSTDSDQSQIDKFKEAARELECDDDEGRFKERLGRLAKRPDNKKGEP